MALSQGKTKINGPHQGAWVDTPYGEDWFIHFQDKYAYGRVIHLQPSVWKDDWLIIGNDNDGDGCGEPVMTWTKPVLQSTGNFQPVEDDDFNSSTLGLQWQFEGPYSQFWYFCDSNHSRLRLYGVQQPERYRNLSDLQNVLLQKFPTENFTVTTKMRFVLNPDSRARKEEAGFIIKGNDYATMKIITEYDSSQHNNVKAKLQYVICKDAMSGGKEDIIEDIPLTLSEMDQSYTQKYAVTERPNARKTTSDIYIRVKVFSSGYGNNIKSHAQFQYSFDGKWFIKLDKLFEVKEGRWIGAKLGYFNSRPEKINDGAYLDIDWIHFHN